VLMHYSAAIFVLLIAFLVLRTMCVSPKRPLSNRLFSGIVSVFLNMLDDIPRLRLIQCRHEIWLLAGTQDVNLRPVVLDFVLPINVLDKHREETHNVLKSSEDLRRL
jgi:hypothetical protein